MAPSCCYFQCKSVTGEKPMFRFPTRNPKRLQTWIDNCGNIKIKHLTKDALRNKYICIDHFEKQYIQNESGKRIRLNKLAVPVHYKGDESTDIAPVAVQDLNLMWATSISRGPLVVQEQGNLFPAVRREALCTARPWVGRLCAPDSPITSTCQGDLKPQPEEDQQCQDFTVNKPNKVYHNYHKQICAELAKDYNNSNSRVGERCTECERSIYGLQWWCLQCSGARCGKCALRMSHRAHYLLRAPAHSTLEQTKAVLAAIRQQLGDDFLRQEDIKHVDENGVDLTVGDEPEVKAEPPELDDDPLDPLAECNPTEEDPLADCKPVITDLLAFASEGPPERKPLKEVSIDYQPESNLNDLQSRFVLECQPEENSIYRPLGVEIYSPVHPGLETFELSLAQCSGIADFLAIEPVKVDTNSIVPSEWSRDFSDDQLSYEDQRPPSIKRPLVPTHFTYTEDNSEDSIKEVDYEQPSPSHVESDTEQDQTKPWVQVLSSEEQNITVNTIQKPKTQPPRIQVSSTKEPQNILAKQQNVQTKRPWVQVFSNIQKSTDTAKQNHGSEQPHIEDLCEEQISAVTEIQNNHNIVQRTEIQDSNQEEQISTKQDSIVKKQTATANRKRKKKIVIVKKRPRIQYATHIQRDFKEPTDNDDIDNDVQSVTETDTLDINMSTEPTNTLLNLDDLIRDKVLEYPSDIEELT